MSVEYITEPVRAGQAALELCTQPVLGLDTETTGLDPLTSRIRLIQFATREGKAFVFDLDRVSLTDLVPAFRPVLVAHHAAFEYAHLTHAGITLDPLHDSMLLSRLTHHKSLKLGEAASKVLGINMDKALQVSDWSGELSREQIEYAGLDAVVTLRLLDALLPMVDKAGQRRLYRLWLHALPVLGDMTRRGHSFDWEGHGRLLEHWQQRYDQSSGLLAEHMPGINPRSGPQIGTWLADNLDSNTLEHWPKTGTGRFKTDADTLQLHATLPAVAPLLEFKQLAKMLSTYGNGYLKYRAADDRMHSQFVLGQTLTGRLASRNPNIQNPLSSKEFRSLFIPGEGRTMVGADYSQIELRTAALLSGDVAMLAAYCNGQDFHTTTAAAVAGVGLDAVTKDQRQAAKCINFGTLFGSGPAGLSRNAQLQYGVSMSKADARQSLAKFQQAYPHLAHWQQVQLSTAKLYRQVQTRLGLIRDFDAQGAGYLKGEALNVPIQGSAVECLLSALTRLPSALNGIDAYPVNTVHDEIVLSVAPEDADAAAAALCDAMVQGFLDVFPEGEGMKAGLVETKTGQNWARCH